MGKWKYTQEQDRDGSRVFSLFMFLSSFISGSAVEAFLWFFPQRCLIAEKNIVLGPRDEHNMVDCFSKLKHNYPIFFFCLARREDIQCP